MVPPTPTPSPRLLRAAQAEREQLARHRCQLLRARESLRVELDRIDASLQEVDASDALVLEVKGSGQFGYVEFRESLYGLPLDIQQ